MRVLSQLATLSLFILIAMQSMTNAQEPTPLYVIGSGINSCGAYLQAAASERRERPPSAGPDQIYDIEYLGFMEFAAGFLTGVNW
jgi:hypothetical protein